MKTLIIGNSGSGKTWLATRLAEHHSLPVIHLDELFWKPKGFEEPRSESEQSRLLHEACCQPGWIAEGVFGHLARQTLPFTELLVWLDLDLAICLEQLNLRAKSQTTHMGREQTEEGLAELLVWARAYETRASESSRAGHAALFKQFKGTRRHLRTPSEVQAFTHEAGIPHEQGV